MMLLKVREIFCNLYLISTSKYAEYEYWNSIYLTLLLTYFYFIFLHLQTVSFISCCTWFLVVGALNHYKDEESIASPTFWSFMSFVFFIPGGAALIMLMVVLHLVNYVSV